MTGDAAGYAAVLRERGVQAGDRVALLIRNEVAFPLTWLALARLGATAAPVNTSQFTSGTTGRHRAACCRIVTRDCWLAAWSPSSLTSTRAM